MDDISGWALALSSKGPLARLNKKCQLRQPSVCLDHFSAELGSHTPLHLLTLTEGLGLWEHSLEYLPPCIWLGLTVVDPARRDWTSPAGSAQSIPFLIEILTPGRVSGEEGHDSSPSPKGVASKEDFLLLKQ